MFLPLLAGLLPAATAQSSGTFSLQSGDGCIVLSQVATLSTPFSLTSSRPICPDKGGSISWPLTSGGNGAASSLAIYANFQNGSPGCIMALSQMQAMYILGRDLAWRPDGLWDNNEQGLLRDPTNFNVMTCGSDGTYLPSGFTLPDPTSTDGGAASWSTSYTLEVNGGYKAPAPAPKPSPEPVHSPEPAPSSSPSPQPLTFFSDNVVDGIQTSASDSQSTLRTTSTVTITISDQDDTVSSGSVTSLGKEIATTTSSDRTRSSIVSTATVIDSISTKDGSSPFERLSSSDNADRTLNRPVVGIITSITDSTSKSTEAGKVATSSRRVASSSANMRALSSSSEREVTGIVTSADSAGPETAKVASSSNSLGRISRSTRARSSTGQQPLSTDRTDKVTSSLVRSEDMSSSRRKTKTQSLFAIQTSTSATPSPPPSPSPNTSPRPRPSPSPSPQPSPDPAPSPSPDPVLSASPAPAPRPAPQPETSTKPDFVFTDGSTTIGQFTLPGPEPSSKPDDNPLDAPVFGPDGQLLNALLPSRPDEDVTINLAGSEITATSASPAGDKTGPSISAHLLMDAPETGDHTSTLSAEEAADKGAEEDDSVASRAKAILEQMVELQHLRQNRQRRKRGDARD